MRFSIPILTLLSAVSTTAFRRSLQRPSGLQRSPNWELRSHADVLSGFASIATAYSDDQNAFMEGVSVSTATSISITAIGLGVLFAQLTQSLRGGGSLVVELSPVETVAVDKVDLIYDPTEEALEMTEAGTVGEVLRKQEALAAKKAYQRGKADRDVRDKTLGYAEVDLAWLATLLRQVKPAAGESFVDLGSGMGKAVLGAAALYPDLGKAEGIEILPKLHRRAGQFAKKLTSNVDVKFINRDFCDIDDKDVVRAISEADIIFLYATKFASESDVLTEGSAVLTELAKPGARIVSIDRRLKGPFRLLKEVDDLRGDLQLTSGYIYEKRE